MTFFHSFSLKADIGSSTEDKVKMAAMSSATASLDSK